MKILLLFLFPIISNAQKPLGLAALSDSSSGVFSTATRLKIKTDSLADALATANAALLALKTNLTDTAGMLTNYLRKAGSAATLTNFPTLNQNTTGTAANVTSIISFANGGISASAATSATTGTMTVPMTSSVITITPTGACTFNASGGVAGQVITFSITTSGTTSFVLTWGTNFRKVGTLATGTVSARFFSVSFICINGTIWQEISRTAVQT